MENIENGYIHLKGFGATRGVVLNGNMLMPERSYSFAKHSPDGFNWGYSGSGPAQLALAIMLEVTDEQTAVKYYQSFKEAIVAQLPDAGFDVRINFDKFLTATINAGNGKVVHAYELIDFKIINHYFSKFLDFPSMRYSSAVFQKDTKEYELIINLSDAELIELRTYLSAKTTVKVPTNEENPVGETCAKLIIQEDRIVVTDLLGATRELYTGTQLSIWN